MREQLAAVAPRLAVMSMAKLAACVRWPEGLLLEFGRRRRGAVGVRD